MNKALAVGAVTFVATVGAGMLFILRPQQSAEPLVSNAPTPAVSPQGERVAIPTLGLTVVKPASWSTVSAEENVRNLQKVEMDDRQLQQLAVRYSTAPIVAFAKYQEPYDDLNPSFKINVRRLGAFAGHAPEEILEGAIPTLRRMFGDLRIENSPSPATISGKKAAYIRLSYTMHAGGRSFPAVSEIWVVPSGPVYFMIGTGTRADEKNGSRAEVRAVVDSIQID